jgi:hypothetical protein
VVSLHGVRELIMNFDFLLDIDLPLIAQKTMQIFKYGALVGFLVTTVLIINLNNKAFNTVFKDRAKSYFWFFLIISVIPLLAFIYIFNLLFARFSTVFGVN